MYNGTIIYGGIIFIILNIEQLNEVETDLVERFDVPVTINHDIHLSVGITSPHDGTITYHFNPSSSIYIELM